MLVDFFGHINLKQDSKIAFSFDELLFYKQWGLNEQKFVSPGMKLVSLHKNNPHYDHFSRDQEHVYVLGFIFPRQDFASKLPKARLKASEIYQAIKTWGDQWVEKVKGSFAVISIKGDTRQVKVYTDPLNIRQVFYYQSGPVFMFSSSINALVHFLQKNRQPVEINEKSLIQYYLFDYILDNTSFIKGISPVPNGAVLSYRDQQVNVKPYFDPHRDLLPAVNYDESTALKHLGHLLEHNMALYLQDHEKVAVALTGGYDSRLNLALLSDKKAYNYYSYGVRESYDIRIPEQIAASLDLPYQAFYINGAYHQKYDHFAQQAVYLGDGIAEMSRANFIYPFSQLSRQYDQILTGLFGSELIKQPTSTGLFIDRNTKRLLTSNDTDQTLDHIFGEAYQQNYLSKELLKTYEDEIRQDIHRDKFFNAALPLAHKLFYFILMQGTRKYFMKEIKIEKPFVENLHPFFDLEFIQLLIQTPFAWVNNLSLKKNLIKSLQNHRFYTNLLEKYNTQLAKIISTHAYSPRLLNYKLLYPLVGLQYLFYKKKFRSVKSFNDYDLYKNFYHSRKASLDHKYHQFNNEEMENNFPNDVKNFNKLVSFQQWAFFNKIS